MTQQRYTKPLPLMQPESDFYWEKTREGELWIITCRDCGDSYFYPRPICPWCFSRNTDWLRSTGKGVVYAFAIVHRAPTPAFQADVPYVAAIVELDEGPRLATNLVDVEPDPQHVHVGLRVEVLFDAVTDEVTLPKFRPA